MYGLAVYVKENSADSFLCFGLSLLHSVSYFFFIYWSPSSSLCMVFDSVSSNMMRFSRSTHLLMFLSLENLTSIRSGLPILVELIDLVNSAIIFLSQMTLLRWLTFLLGSQTVILIVLLFWISFFLLTLVFVLQRLSLHWEILIMLLSQFPLIFHQIHNGMPHFIT